ncbi:unnamed protein product [Chironomus riparius]|uniref:Uncharacterized protein n=1 Tax=Chironomus riparius TaxID=315576 RepID=A0A9N9WY30_9DIPT|nr:unnamed protein product [Chironomus riparius]
MITVIVDKKEHMATSKVFAVQKYTLPLFDVFIDLPETHVIRSRYFTFSIYAKYSFGEYVKGNAEVVIRNPEDNKEFYREKFTDITKPKVIRTNSLDNLYFGHKDQIDLEIFLLFTEASSGIKFNKTAALHAHEIMEGRVKVFHDEKWLPGFPFTTKIYTYDWKYERTYLNAEDVDLTIEYRTQERFGALIGEGEIRDGVYVHEFTIPMDYIEFGIDARIGIYGYPYRKTIERGSANVGMNSLLVSHLPENPGLNSTAKVYVTSMSPLNNIIMSTITRYGNIKTRQIDCGGKTVCEIAVVIDEQMMPHSTVLIYDVRDEKSIFQGQTKIVTEDLGRNYLRVDLQFKEAKTRQNIKMKLSTKENSKVYLLAFDKRLTYLKDGNDFTKDDVVKSVADYDGINKILIDDMKSWKVCTQEEVDRVMNGRVTTKNQGGTEVHYPEEPPDDMTLYQGRSSPFNPPKTEDGLLREYFPETWIFETIEVGSKSSLDKTYTVPDSMTTWLLSAFSVNNDHGIATSSRQDLIIKNEFFMEMNLPYSIRYTEVLKLEILVFNYIDTNEEVTVDLKLNNLNDGMEFQFVDYSSDCTASYHDGTQATAKVKVPFNEVSTVNFYIRSHPSNNKFDNKKQKMMTIDVEASTTDSSWTKHSDHVQKKLIVDPVGIKVYMVSSDFFKLDGGTTNSHVQKTNYCDWRLPDRHDET